MPADPFHNEVWRSLTGPQAHLAVGEGRARRYHSDVAPFAAVEDADEGYAGLAEIVPSAVTVALRTMAPVAALDGFEIVRSGALVRLVANRFSPVAVDTAVFRDLDKADVPAMLELVDLTRPGPFATRTHEMGRYIGIFDGHRLVAMTGERTRLPGYTEVSAVCTHPDHRGRGYAKMLVSVIGGDIVARGEVPFLHVFPDNPALATYEKLGFRSRTDMFFMQAKRL